MTNATISQIPNSLNDLTSTRRFLLRVIERLDELEGSRGENPSVNQEELNAKVEEINTAIATVQNLLSDLENSIDKRLLDLEDDVDSVYVFNQDLGVVTEISELI